MLSDGYGEASGLDHDMLNTAIDGPWVLRMVRAVAPYRQAEWDDLAQEARLAMWNVAPRWDGRGELMGYLHQHARWKVLSVISGEHTYTGTERKRATTQRRGDETREKLRSAVASLKRELGRDPKPSEVAERMGIHPVTVRKQLKKLHLTKTEVQAQVGSLDAMIDAYGAEVVFEAVDKMDGIVLAYHYGEIHQAVSELEPLWREYVYLRFWQGYGDLEISRTLGSRVHWNDRVRPYLAQRLAHLALAI